MSLLSKAGVKASKRAASSSLSSSSWVATAFFCCCCYCCSRCCLPSPVAATKAYTHTHHSSFHNLAFSSPSSLLTRSAVFSSLALFTTTTTIIIRPTTATATLTTMASSTTTTTTGVDIETSNGKRLHFIWHPSVNSTQDAMKTLLVEDKDTHTHAVTSSDIIALAAGAQTKGRGTSGRAWVGLSGNTFLTIAIPVQTLTKDLSYPITLFPLRIGTLVAREIMKMLPSPEAKAKVNLKWPNDVLIGDDKVSGLLIEMDGSAQYYLVGVGVNVAHAPVVPVGGADRGRTATCLGDHGVVLLPVEGEEAAVDAPNKELSLGIARAVAEWVGEMGEDTGKKVAAEWGEMAVWGKEYRRRDDDSVVIPLGLEADGRLKVRNQATGAIAYLAAEYLH